MRGIVSVRRIMVERAWSWMWVKCSTSYRKPTVNASPRFDSWRIEYSTVIPTNIRCFPKSMDIGASTMPLFWCILGTALNRFWSSSANWFVRPLPS